MKTLNPRSFNSANKGFILEALGVVALIVVLLVVGVWALATYALPGMIQSTLANKTGFPVSSKAFKLDVMKGRVELQDFVVQNPQQFGGGTFISVPSLIVEADPMSLITQSVHIREFTLHVAEAAIVQNESGQRNSDAFNQGLQSLMANNSAAQQKAENQPQPKVRIDKLKLQIDNAKLVNLGSKPATTTMVPLNIKFERMNVTDIQQLQREITQVAMQTGLKTLGPVAAQMLANTAIGSVGKVGDVAGAATEQVGAVTGQATEKVGQAVDKVTGAAESIRNIFNGFGN